MSILLCLLAVPPVRTECPSAGSVEAELRQLDLAAAYRTQELGLPPPWSLYRKAAGDVEKVMIERSGKLGQAVVLYQLPIESLWMAINDEDHYADDGYLPVEHSEVIDGTPRGERRILFQFFKRSGFGRWWIDEVVMNRELYETSAGRLWELRWRDLMDDYAEKGLPGAYADMGLAPIRESRGAWLMVPLTEHCTLVEYATSSNPGGFLNVAQWLASGQVMRENLEGVERLVAEHLSEPHPEARFIRPDGTSIEMLSAPR